MVLIGKEEQETTVVKNNGSDEVLIWSNIASDILKLRRNGGVKIIREGRHGRTHWVEARVARDQWNPVGGVKRQTKRVMTEEQRLAAGERLKKAREERAR